jgi:hypothetical protein
MTPKEEIEKAKFRKELDLKICPRIGSALYVVRAKRILNFLLKQIDSRKGIT